MGLLLTGDSGAGKSDAALGLLDRGHRLVADDAVELRRCGTRLHGSCPPALLGQLAIRGLGVLDVRLLYGPDCMRASQRIDLEVALEPRPPSADALMIERDIRSIMGAAIPRLRLPYISGRDLPLLLQTAARAGMADTGG